MDIDIEEFNHDDFFKLPKKKRVQHLVIDLFDENGKVWRDKPPAPKIKAVKFEKIPNKVSWENIYLDFYNLDVENREACYEFIIQNGIMYVEERKKYDESGAAIFTAGDLQSYHFLYKKHFDFLIQEDSAERLKRDFEQLEKEDTGGAGFSPGGVVYRPFQIYHEINEHLKRCHLMLGLDEDEENYYYYRDHKCEDFLALAYLQLCQSVSDNKKHTVCPHCGEVFSTLNLNKKYCNDDCRKKFNDKKRSEKRQTDQKEREKYRNYLKNYMQQYR
jgi:hypothetical protein